MTTLDKKEEELKDQFNNEQQEAVQIEEQIKALQTKHQEKIVNMTRIQGAFSLLQDLRKEEESKEIEPEKIEETEETETK